MNATCMCWHRLEPINSGEMCCSLVNPGSLCTMQMVEPTYGDVRERYSDACVVLNILNILF